jgi:hypothetical protein
MIRDVAVTSALLGNLLTMGGIARPLLGRIRMGVHMHKSVRSIAAVSFAILYLLFAPGLARGATGVHPRQAFVGKVNGSFRTASLVVNCASAAVLTGHAAGGQFVAVIPPPPVAIGIKLSIGETGTRAQRIVVRFSGDPSVAVTLRKIAVNVPIPTTLTLPCSGKGSVTFRPMPASTSARSSTVPVVYETA